MLVFNKTPQLERDDQRELCAVASRAEARVDMLRLREVRVQHFVYLIEGPGVHG